MSAWGRLPEESTPAYAAFKAYVDFGSHRSIEAVHRKLTKSTRLLKRWSSKYSWVERAGLYDEHMVRVQQRAREAAEVVEAQTWARRRAKLLEEEFEIGQKLIEKARQMLQMPIVEVKREVVVERHNDGRDKIVQLSVLRPVRFTMSDAGRMFMLADKLIRLSLGMPTQVIGEDKFEETPPAGEAERLTDEELVLIARGNLVTGVTGAGPRTFEQQTTRRTTGAGD
jgi:hypothetical protein